MLFNCYGKIRWRNGSVVDEIKRSHFRRYCRPNNFFIRIHKNKKLIHGDLVWFNLGYINDTHLLSGIRIILLDFDRSSLKLNAKFAEIDVLRLIMELYASVATPVQKN